MNEMYSEMKSAPMRMGILIITVHA